MTQRCGDTLLFRTPPVIAAQAAVGGKKEGEGPLAAAFDELSSDNRFGQSSWEAAEKYLQLRAARLCLQKAQLPEEKVRLVLAGDLQAQCTASGYAMRELGVPFAGVFGACSTMAETLGLGAALCASGAAEHLLAMASSHFCAAERQFRTPLSYGAVRTPTAQWTVPAAGCCLLQPAGPGVPIAAATFGRVQDYQVRDINNMGAAMAPAAASTLLHYFADTHTEPQEFDCIYTGDLGQVGSSLLRELLAAEGLLVKNHVDCGCILFDAAEQQVKSGGSGPGCCAAVLCGHILPRLLRRSQKRVGVPFAGVFGACSTMAETLGLGAALCASGAAEHLLAMASSHFCAAERQFRTPLSYGAVRTPTAQWTVPAAGCCLLQPAGPGVPIAAATFGRVQDYQVRDINNMGAAMAPAAASTLLHYFADTHTEPQEFDCIYTGDLGQVGSSLLRELLAAEGLLVKNHVDCGCILFDAAEQQVKSGGSGPGCCAAVLCGHILPRLLRRSQKRVLFVATGALMSQTTFLQKESIPAVAHLVELRAPEKESGA